MKLITYAHIWSFWCNKYQHNYMTWYIAIKYVSFYIKTYNSDISVCRSLR